MRRALVLLTSVLFLICASAGIASAQLRDPFQPVISDDGVVQPDNGGNSDGNMIPDVGPFNGGDDELPFTGSDTSGWVVLAYGLIAGGATAICVARARRPISLR